MKVLKTTVKIHRSDFEGQYDNAIRSLALQSQQILHDSVVQEIRNRGLVAEEDLINSFYDVPINLDVDPILIQVQSEDIAGPAQEYGTKPSTVTDKKGRPIVNPYTIQAWLQAKGDDGGIQKAYAIALKIGAQGLPLRGGPKRFIAHSRLKAMRRIKLLWESKFPSFFVGPRR